MVAVLSLGLGIGANTAIFTLIDEVLLGDVPYRDPHNLRQECEARLRMLASHSVSVRAAGPIKKYRFAEAFPHQRRKKASSKRISVVKVRTRGRLHWPAKGL